MPTDVAVSEERLPSCVFCNSIQTMVLGVCDNDVYAATLACDFCGAHGPTTEDCKAERAQERAIELYKPGSIVGTGRRYRQYTKRKYAERQ